MVAAPCVAENTPSAPQAALEVEPFGDFPRDVLANRPPAVPALCDPAVLSLGGHRFCASLGGQPQPTSCPKPNGPTRLPAVPSDEEGARLSADAGYG